MQFGEKIRELRQAKGYSIQNLADLVGVSKPAIQQYEDNTINPSNKILKRIADVLNVGIWYFFSVKKKTLSLIDFRDGHTLFNEELEKAIIQDNLKIEAQNYLELATIMNAKIAFENPISDIEIKDFADIEKAVKKLRKKWRLGDSPIDDVTSLLETKGFLIFTIERPTSSQGVCGYIEDEDGNIPVIIVNTNRDKEVTRKRFTILHEAGHLILSFSPEISKEQREKMCNFFAAAMLLVNDVMLSFIGKDRTSLSLDELVYLKETYGISIQAIIWRANDINLINDWTKNKWLSIYENWTKEKRFLGTYSKSTETSNRFKNLLIKALVEKRISKEKAVELTGFKLDKLEEEFNNKTLEL